MNKQQKKIKMPKITDVKSLTFYGEKVTLEVSNTSRKFCWRLKCGKFSTHWSSHYKGILTLRSQKTNNLYAVAMAYWDGALPIENHL